MIFSELGIRYWHRRFYYEGYRDGLMGPGLGWFPELNKRQRDAFEIGKQHGEADARALKNDKFMLSKLVTP